jgi:hypothetical protein
MFKTLLILSAILFLTACDKKAQVVMYDKSLKNNKLKCLGLAYYSGSKLEQELKKLYKFSDNCPYKLELSYKAGIVCNSRYNVPQKVTSNFPTAYIKLEVTKGLGLEYSYYKDLTHKPDISDLKDAFNQLKDDILK